tara:strand:+ start:604 stop:1965 length:1362 start_codon:yes stop_codon:yes gene_type:complete
MGKLRKIGKKVWKGIKKLGKKIGKGFKKVFAGVSKFLGKLGPIGTIGMMIAMPWLGSYVWSGFSSWAGGLSGTFGKIMQGVVKVGNSVMGAYSSVTDAVYGTLKKIPGVGDALEGMDRWLDKTRSAMGMESGSMSVMNDKELNGWVNTESGATALGYDNAAAFKQANPNFFNAEGKLTTSGLNFTRGKGLAYEAHLRGRDVFKKVNGEFDFNTYSDSFKNNVLDTDFGGGNISKFGESLQGKGKVAFRTGSPQGIRDFNKEYQNKISTLSDDELKAFKPGESSYENWKKSFDASAQTVYTSPEKGFFGQDKLSPSDPNYKITGDVAFENVGSRYSHQVPIKDKKGNIIRYSREEGTKLGTAAWGGIKKTAVAGMGGGEQVQVEGGTVYQPRVADPMPLAAPSVAPLQLQLPKTQIALDYLGVLNNQTMSPQLLGQQMNSGIVMPHIIGLNYAS